jgi:hypothetical protein
VLPEQTNSTRSTKPRPFFDTHSYFTTLKEKRQEKVDWGKNAAAAGANAALFHQNHISEEGYS